MFEAGSEHTTEFLPGLVFKELWGSEGVTEGTKSTIWKYLQLLLFNVVGDLSSSDSFGEAANLFEAIDEEELKGKLEETIKGDEELIIRTELKGGVGKYGRLLGWLYIGDADVSLNEQMITEGYAWAYDGGTKQKNFEELREIRRSFGTLAES